MLPARAPPAVVSLVCVCDGPHALRGSCLDSRALVRVFVFSCCCLCVCVLVVLLVSLCLYCFTAPHSIETTIICADPAVAPLLQGHFHL